MRLFSKKEKRETEFSRFIRTAPSGEKKKVFMDVLEKATKDQRAVIAKSDAKTA